MSWNMQILKSKIGYNATFQDALVLRNFLIELGYSSIDEVYESYWNNLVKKAFSFSNE